MKRLLSFVLALVLLVSFVSMSFAAVTVGGNLRVWYQAVTDKQDSAYANDSYANGFRFDRLALTLGSELSAVDGFKGEVQFRQTRNDADSQYSKATYGTDIRIDSAYYYQKAMFLSGDEFDLGYISQVPFKSGLGSVIVFDMLADDVVNGRNSLGIKYAQNFGSFDFALALVNANKTYAYNNDNGLDYGLRVNYTVIPGLKVGAGYLRDTATTTKSGSGAAAVTTSNVASTDTYATSYVVDASYTLGSFGAYVEYLSYSKHTSSDTLDAANGLYLEANYKLSDALSFYAAREISLSDENIYTSKTASTIPAMKYADGMNGNITANDNWTAIGAKYQFAPNTALQAEYARQDAEKMKSIAAIRCMVSF